MKKKVEAELIFIPTPTTGHLIPILELAKRLIAHDGTITITVLSMRGPFAPLADSATESLADSQTRIRIIRLPEVDPPSIEFSNSPEAFLYSFLESCLPPLRRSVQEIASSGKVVALVLDFFCMPFVTVPQDLGIPWYIFLPNNAGFLGLMLGLPFLHVENCNALQVSDPELSLPGWCNPVPVSVLPGVLFETYGGYNALVRLAARFKDANGILVNSFDEFEPFAIQKLVESGNYPRIYTVGPVIDLSFQSYPEHNSAQRDKILKWLDQQPEMSVVFLCFGSMGSFEATQLKEIATGLERSGQRFLWSLRGPSVCENVLESLPEGFLERIRDRGMICQWAPQKEVLAHRAVGGFMSHCGWNSIIESLWFGVPIATWPLYAEQQLNAFKMAKELGLAVELRLDRQTGGKLVAADEVAEAVRQVMDGGGVVRKKVAGMSEKAKMAVGPGGSSFSSLCCFINDVLGD